MEYGHAFTTYYDTYHTAHPEWFNLLPDGTRITDPYYAGGIWNDLISMSVAEPGLWSQIVDNWLAEGQDGTPWINGTENDTNGKCTCPGGMAWDVKPDTWTQNDWDNRYADACAAFYNAQSDWSEALGPMSDRYCNFWLALQNEAVCRGYPDATVFGLAYVNYKHAPINKDGALNENIIVGYVPSTSFPWTSTERTEACNDWDGWRNTGCRMFYRPNYTLLGHNLPIYYADCLVEDFVYCYRRGMIATDFDSLTGQYATQAPTLYALARIHTLAADTSRSASELLSDILDEFYSSFGAASDEVQEYFEYWETISEGISDYPDPYYKWYVHGADVFTPSVMSTARTKLNAAITAASGDSAVEARLAFLENGLDDVELTLAAQEAWEDYMDAGDLDGWLDAVGDLDDARAAMEADFPENMAHLAAEEAYEWDRNIAAIDVSAGDVWPIHGDRISTSIRGGYLYYQMVSFYGDNDTCYVLLDLGSAQAVSAINITNRADVATNYNFSYVRIYVAPDESSGSFVVHDPDSYTTQVYDNYALPLVNTAGTSRQCDITNVTRRYILIEVISNLWGNLSISSNYVCCMHDIDIE